MTNPKSGGKDGEFILSTFRKLLNPIQVIDLTESPPENGLEICRMLEHLHCRLLVCGGDGTVGWVLSTLDKLQLPVSGRKGEKEGEKERERERERERENIISK